MKKFLLSFIIGLAVLLNPVLTTGAQAYTYYPSTNYNSDLVDYPIQSNYQNGNERYKQKRRLEIIRGSKPVVHNYATSGIRGGSWKCKWTYVKYLDEWQCKKEYVEPYPQLHSGNYRSCEWGFELSRDGRYCRHIKVPAHAHIVKEGSAWACDPGYTKNYYGNGCKLESRNTYYSAYWTPALSYSQTSSYYQQPVYRRNQAYSGVRPTSNQQINPYYAYCMTYYGNTPLVNCSRLPLYSR